jgi:hypothetical protein
MIAKRINNAVWNSIKKKNVLSGDFIYIIDNFFKPDVIDFDKFNSNLIIINDPFDGMLNMEPSAERKISYNVRNNISKVISNNLAPDWFMAAYPDVLVWMFYNNQILKSNSYYNDLFSELVEKLQTNYNYKMIRFLIDFYQSKTRKVLECKYP